MWGRQVPPGLNSSAGLLMPPLSPVVLPRPTGQTWVRRALLRTELSMRRASPPRAACLLAAFVAALIANCAEARLAKLGPSVLVSHRACEAKSGSLPPTHANMLPASFTSILPGILPGILQVSSKLPAPLVCLPVTQDCAARNGGRHRASVFAILPVRVAQAASVMGWPSDVGPVS